MNPLVYNSTLLDEILRLLRDKTRVAAVAAFVLSTIGCGSDTKKGATQTTTTPDAGTGGGSGTSNDAGDSGICNNLTLVTPAPDLNGTWALQTVASRYVPATGLTSAFYTRTISVLLADVTETGSQISLSAQYCNQYAEDPDALAHVVIPDAYVSSLAPFVRTGTYAVDDSGTTVLTFPNFVEVEGAHLTDLAQDALPTSASDSRVFDQDQDGNPGVTIKLTGPVSGDLYVVQRQISELTGVATTVDRVSGHYGFTSEQVILDSNPTSLKALAAQTAIVDPDACDSTFTLVRVAAAAACADVLANSTLFD